MGVTAQAGILGFGPQAAKGTLASTWYRHRAMMIDLDVADDVREGPPEVGGIAVPTFPYKAGPIVAGGFTLQPRLESTLGWLMYGLMGSCETSPTGTLDPDSVCSDESLTALGAKTLDGNPSTPSLLLIAPTGLTGTAILTITGTNSADAVIYEVINVLTATAFFTKNVFKTVTSVNVDKAAGAGTLDIGSYTGAPYNHLFKLDANSSYVPWMSFRKLIPAVDDDYTTDLGQVFKDCKMIGGTFVLPNDSPINMRADVIGREFELTDTPDAWVWQNTFEHWESIPVACMTDGVIEIGGEEMPVVAMQVGFANVPLDIRQERIFGDPFILDVTTIQRRLTFDVTIKWQNPQLYRKVLTASPTGTQWSGKPHTGALHVKTVSSVDMPGQAEPYSLQVDADEVMLTQVGGIQLAGNQSIMMRFTGVALEATDYAIFTLRNLQAAYNWPV